MRQPYALHTNHHDERMECHRCTKRRNTCCSRGLQLPGGLCRSQGRLLQRGLLVLGRLLASRRPGRPLLCMLLLQALLLLLLQLVLLLLLLLVRVDLQCARRPLSLLQMHCVVPGALQEHCFDAVMREVFIKSLASSQSDSSSE